MYSGGVPTRHTQMGRPTYEAPTREYYTHKHTQTQTNTQRGPTKYGADLRRGGALLIRGGRLAPTPSKLHLCRLMRETYRTPLTAVGAVARLPYGGSIVGPLQPPRCRC